MNEHGNTFRPRIHSPKVNANCSAVLRAEGKPYPRTCPQHGLISCLLPSATPTLEAVRLARETGARRAKLDYVIDGSYRYHCLSWAERNNSLKSTWLLQRTVHDF